VFISARSTQICCLLAKAFSSLTQTVIFIKGRGKRGFKMAGVLSKMKLVLSLEPGAKGKKLKEP
jgi:hypothetical protein